MKKVRDNTRVPRKPWKYTNPEDGTVLQSPYYNVLKGKVKDYRRANNYPIGLLFDDQFDEILCAHQPDACVEFTPPSEMTRATSLVKAMAKWAASGFKTRTSEQAEANLEICRSCNFYDGESGLLRIVCKQCRCSKKKAWLASEHCPIGKW